MSKFKIWVDDVNVGENTQGPNDFEDDNQRKTGFQPNTAASAIRVNSALRQANVVACALMEALLPNNTTLSLRSSVNDVKEGILDKLPFDPSTQKLKNNTVPLTAISASINTALSDYDSEKGSIEQRLTDLGFSSGNATNLNGVNSVTLKKLGKFVICKFTPTEDSVSFNLPEGFRPYSNVTAYSGIDGRDASTGGRKTHGRYVYNITSTGLVSGSGSIEPSIMISRSYCVVGWSIDSNYPIN